MIDSINNIVTYKTGFYSEYFDNMYITETIAVIPKDIVPLMHSLDIHDTEVDYIHEIKVNGKRYIVKNIHIIEGTYILRMQEVE